jgi:type IV secretory pathway VirJ component
MLALQRLVSVLLSLNVPATEPLHYGLFGDLHVARPAQSAQGAVVFFSDRDGWTAHEDAYAAALAGAGQLVLGIDLPAYLKELGSLDDTCSRPEAHVQEVVHWMERHENFADYRAPRVIGLGSGANFAYATTAQAPTGAFSDLVTVGWRYAMRTPKPLCAGDAGEVSRADGKSGEVISVASFPVPWWPMPLADSASFDGFAVLRASSVGSIADLWSQATSQESNAPRRLIAQLGRVDRARTHHADPLAQDVADLPLTEIDPTGPVAPIIAVVVTGDGGWAGLDKGIAEVLSQQGVRVVGFSSLKYFWRTRKPEEAATDLTRVISHYSVQQPDARFVLVGYSFGASLAPIVVNRMPADIQKKISAQFMISPDPEAVFEIKVGDWFGNAHHEGTIPVGSEVAKSPIPVFCVHGEEEEDSVCPQLDAKTTTQLRLPGGHHYDGDYAALGHLVAAHLPK